MGKKRLLERVRGWESNHTGYSGDKNGMAIESVVLHLKKLLNTRQGTTLVDVNYGMPDFTDLKLLFPDSVREIEKSISSTIETYEPRLSQVKVDFLFQDEQNLSLLFHIEASLKTEKDLIDVHLESSLDAGGKMKIKR